MEALLLSLRVISDGSPRFPLPSARPIRWIMFFFCSERCCDNSSSGSPAFTPRPFSHSITPYALSAAHERIHSAWRGKEVRQWGAAGKGE